MQVKVIAMVLCFAMVLSGIPAGAISLFGEASSSTEITPEQPVFDQKAKPYILGEVEDKRGETEKHFMMSDKSFTAVQYGEPVHYKDVNEKWADINNTLSDSSAKDAEDVDGVENTANSFKVKFAKKADSKKLVSITKGDYQLSWNLDGAANNKDAKLKNPDLSKQETGDDKFIKLKKLSSEVTYSSILPNTDLQYFINGSGVKENIIVNVKQDTYEYALNMKTKKLNLSLDDKGQVIATDIKDTANVIFTIPAPVMFDANNKQSNAVQYSLVQNDNKDYILKIVADPNWINSGNVQFPITIDPIVLSKNDQANIDSTFVSSSVNYDDTNFNSYSLLAVGTESYAYQNCRTLVKITTPILPKGSIVINSQYAVYQYEYGYYATSTPTKILNVNKITSAWNPNTVTWNNHPSYDAIISDNNPIEKTTGWVYYDVTKIVKSWYAGETNNGLLIKSNSEKPVGGSDATYSAYAFLASDKYATDPTAYPKIIVNYRNYQGLESQWDYETQDIGRAGTGYVNKYTGSLTYIHNDVSETGNLMPTQINHIYNDTQAGSNTAKKAYAGVGWQMNISQSITTIASTDPIWANGYRYIYMDGDGTNHYYMVSGTTFVDENDPNLILSINTADSYNYFVIKDKQDNMTKFTVSGYFHMFENANGKNSYVQYNGYNPTYMMDGSLRQTNFALQSYGYIQTITEPSGRDTDYAYNAYSELSSITYYDGTATAFDYDGYHRMASITYMNSRIVYTHDAKDRVTFATECGKKSSGVFVEGQKVGFTYSLDKTVVRTSGTDDIYGNSDDQTMTYLFDDYGRTISSYDNKNMASANSYDSLNKLKNTSQTADLTNNLVLNSSNEYTNNWSTGSWQTGTGNTYAPSQSTTNPLAGAKSFQLSNAPATGNQCYSFYYQYIPISANKDYTISAYVKTNFAASDTKGAIISAYINEANTVVNYSTPVCGVNTTWQRISLTVHVPATSATTMAIMFGIDDAVGMAWFDCIQAEEGTSVNRYNLLENPEFSSTTGGLPNSWTGSGLSSSDVVAVVYNDATASNSNAMKITGDINVNKSIRQVIPVNAICNKDIFVFSGWAKGDSLSCASDGRYFALDVGITYEDGTDTDWVAINFSSDTSNFQFTSEVIMGDVANTGKTISSLTVYCLYYKNANTAYFDDLQLVMDNSQSYTYDAAGNVVSTVDKAKNDSTFKYTNNNLNSMVNPDGTSFTYGYDSKHNLVQARSSNDINYAVTYDATTGNPTATTTSAIQTAKSIVNNTEYNITSTNSASRVEISGNVSQQNDPNRPIVNWYQRSNDSQKWRAVYISGSAGLQFKLESVSSSDNKVLSAAGSVDGSGIQLQAYTGSTSQRWVFEKRPDGSYRIKPYSNQAVCLAEPSVISATSGQALSLKTYSNSNTDDANQRWLIDPVTQSYSKTLSSSATYTTGGNYLSVLTDSRGGTITNNYADTVDNGVNTGLVKKVTDQDSKDTTYTYKKYANETKYTDLLASVSKTFTKPDTTTLSASTRYGYNSDGSLATIKPHTDSESYCYGLTYDAYGNMSNTKVVNQNLMTNTYKANNGKLDYSTYGNGDTIGYTYGDYSRVIEKKYNGVARFKYAYDKEGNLYSYQDLNNVSSPLTYNYSYDVTKRLSSVVGSNGHKMNFKYDAYNRLADFFNIFDLTSYKTSYVYGTGASTTSQAGLLYGIQLNGAQKLTYTYDLLSRLATKKLNEANNYTTSYSYLDGDTASDTTTLLSSMQNGSNGVLSYTYDMKGNILTITEGTTLKATYTYDELNQLKREDNVYVNKSITYDYDVGGNITYKREYAYTTGTLGTVATTTHYVYDGTWKDKLVSYDVTVGSDPEVQSAIVSDVIGNMTSFGTKSFSWEGRQLTGISDSSDSSTNTYTYNDSGIRTSKTVNGVTTNYFLNGDQVVRESNGTDTFDYFYDGNSDLFAFNYNGTGYYYVRNGQNDIIGILDSNGVQVVSYSYDSWGKLISTTGTLADTVGVKNPYRYRGYRYDSETSLYYLNARYYDPVILRYLNADSMVGDVGNVQGYNLFSYCMNNPVMMSDPSGHWPTWGQIFTVVAIVVVTAVVVAAVVIAAPAVAGVVGATAAFYGASAALAGGLATAATIGCAAVAAGVAATGVNRAVEAATGTNYAAKAVGKKNYEKIESAINTAALAITSVPMSTGYPSTGRGANNMNEQIALKSAQSNPSAGNVIIKSLGDGRMPGWMGWQKYQMNFPISNGSNISVHYVGNRVIPIFFDFKING